MNLKTLSFLLLLFGQNQCHPILQDIANWISGIKYVPPPSDSQDKISNEAPEETKLFQPVNKYSPSPSSQQKEIIEEASNVVFNRYKYFYWNIIIVLEHIFKMIITDLEVGFSQLAVNICICLVRRELVSMRAGTGVQSRVAGWLRYTLVTRWTW